MDDAIDDNDKQMTREKLIESKPFRSFQTVRPHLDISRQADIKKRLISKDVSLFNSDSGKKVEYYRFIYRTKNLNHDKTALKNLFENKSNRILKQKGKNGNCINKYGKGFPKELRSFIDPYDYSQKSVYKSQTNTRPQSSRPALSGRSYKNTTHYYNKTEDTHFDTEKNLKDSYSLYLRNNPYNNFKEHPSFANNTFKHDLSLDSELIEQIAREKKELNDKRISLNKFFISQRNDEHNDEHFLTEPIKRHKSKGNYAQKVIPQKSNKYKELTFRKECVFNNEYNIARSINKAKKSNNSHQRLYSASLTGHNNFDLFKKAQVIHKNSNMIKKVLVQDKKYTKRCVKSAMRKKDRKEHPENDYIQKEIQGAKFTALEIVDNGIKEKISVDPFGKLRSILEVYTKKGGDPLTELLESSLLKFCGKGNFKMFLRNKATRDTYRYRLKKNQEIHEQMVGHIKNMENNHYKMKYYERKLKSADI